MNQHSEDRLRIDPADVGTLDIDNLGFDAYRSLALSAGDLRSAVLKEVDRILNKNRSHPVEACKSGLKRLAKADLISQEEVSQLAQICTLIFDQQRNKTSLDDASRQINAIYQPLVVKGNASPVALAIASMAATIELPRGAVSAAATGNGFDIGLAGGAIGGAAIGGAIGGIGGAVIGAVIGGLAGGIAGACAD